MLTDGNPTVWANGTMASGSSFTGQVVRAGIEEAVASANAIKAEGAQIFAIGIGPPGELPEDNLEAISGPGDAILTGFDELAEILNTIATAACQGRSPSSRRPSPTVHPASPRPAGGPSRRRPRP